MPVYDRFVGARRQARPPAYLLPPTSSAIVELFRRQGIRVGRLVERWRGLAERFAVDSVVVEPLFEGHRTLRLEGHWAAPRLHEAAPGWFVVDTDQPLGTFAAYLLEPESEDGVATWNFVEPVPAPGSPYPIVRSRAPVRAASELVP
jgi:hypothetical protein